MGKCKFWNEGLILTLSEPACLDGYSSFPNSADKRETIERK
jgi:hypothetical protein